MIESKKDLQSAEANQTFTPLSRYIESATVITLLIGTTYFIGWSYMDGYFERIGIHHDSLDFPTTYYLMHALMPILLAWMISILLYIGARSSPKNIESAVTSNYIGFFIVIGLVVIGLDVYPSLTAYSLFAVATIILVLTVLLSWKKKSLVNILFSALSTTPIWKTPLLRIVIVITAVLLLSVVARYTGEMHARKRIEGTLHNVIVISFVWKENPPPETEGKELVFIIHRDGRYYVVSKERPAPQYPKVYIIPDGLVESATMTRIN